MTLGKDDVAWVKNAPYTVYAGLNLLACDLTTATTTVTAVVPVTRSYEKNAATDTHGATLIKSNIELPTGEASDGGALNAMSI